MALNVFKGLIQYMIASFIMTLGVRKCRGEKITGRDIVIWFIPTIMTFAAYYFWSIAGRMVTGMWLMPKDVIKMLTNSPILNILLRLCPCVILAIFYIAWIILSTIHTIRKSEREFWRNLYGKN